MDIHLTKVTAFLYKAKEALLDLLTGLLTGFYMISSLNFNIDYERG